jgi:hypothetical protein
MTARLKSCPPNFALPISLPTTPAVCALDGWHREGGAEAPQSMECLRLRLRSFGRSRSCRSRCSGSCGRCGDRSRRCCWRCRCLRSGRRMRSSRWSVRAWGAVAGRAGLRVSARRTRSLRTRGASGERKQRDVARALDRFTEPALVTRADAGHAARQDLSALLHELRQNVGALVVDEIHLLDTKLADFLLAEILALAAARTSGTTARTAFATRATVSTGAAVSAAGTVSTGTRTARG